MQEFQQRVADEEAALRTKLDALAAFTRSPTFLTLDGLNQRLLQEQEHHMGKYLNVLSQRIALFK